MLQASLDHAREDFGLHLPACRQVRGDELYFMQLAAAVSHSRMAHARDLAVRLAGPVWGLTLVLRLRPLVKVMADCGLELTPRSVLGPVPEPPRMPRPEDARPSPSGDLPESTRAGRRVELRLVVSNQHQHQQ